MKKFHIIIFLFIIGLIPRESKSDGISTLPVIRSYSPTPFPSVTGMTWGTIGDSMTKRYGADKYQPYVVTEFSLTLTNVGVSGETLTISEDTVSGGMIAQLDSCYGKDIISVLAPTNDFYYGKPLGSVNSSDNSTICGAVNEIIDSVELYSSSSILFFIGTTCRDVMAGGGAQQKNIKNGIGLRLWDYNNAIKSVCVERGIRFLNLHEYTDLSSKDIDLWAEDGLHPNTAGNLTIANHIIDFMNNEI